MAASVEAIFLSTFVLISQNRMAEMSNKRADLDLQISLLSEHEITRIIILGAEIAQRLGIDMSKNPELVHLAKDVQSEKVLDTIERTERKFQKIKNRFVFLIISNQLNPPNLHTIICNFTYNLLIYLKSNVV